MLTPTENRPAGIVSLVGGLVALVLLAGVLLKMLACSAAIRGGLAPAQACAGSGVISYLVIAGVIALGALLIGGRRVVRCERAGGRAGLASSIGSSLSVLGLGISAGLGLALMMMARSFQVQPIEYDSRLSGVSYVVLTVMLGLIVIGLCLCFYRSIKPPAANTN